MKDLIGMDTAKTLSSPYHSFLPKRNQTLGVYSHCFLGERERLNTMLEELISVGKGYAIFIGQHGFCILKQVALKLF